MTAVNIQRDGNWVKPETASNVAWSSQSALANTTFLMSGPTAVNVDKGTVQAAEGTYTVSAGNQEAIGVFMQAPVSDNTPYRVQASGRVLGFKDYDEGWAIGIGYAPASITGSDDSIEDPMYIPFHRSFDGLIMVPALESGDTFYGRALAIALVNQAGLAMSSLHIKGNLSVQNLAVKAPTMQYSVA